MNLGVQSLGVWVSRVWGSGFFGQQEFADLGDLVW